MYSDAFFNWIQELPSIPVLTLDMLYLPGARHQAGAFIPLLSAVPSPTGPHQPNRCNGGRINCFVICSMRNLYFVILYSISCYNLHVPGSIYFTLAITIERYTTVCHPFFKVSREE